MNIISYDIELVKKEKTEGEILQVISRCITSKYSINLGNRAVVESSWADLPYQEFTSINSSAYLLFSFTVENVQVFLFKKQTKDVISLNDLTITVIAISQKEINLILKSSFSKLLYVFSEQVQVKVIEGTQVNLYPFDFDKNDVLSPSFYVKAEYDNKFIKFEVRDWIKLLLFIVITCIFIVAYFTTPSNIIDQTTKESIPNNIKEVYSAVMALGLGFVIIELITNLLIPKLFKRKYPSIIIKNFSNIFESKGKQLKESNNPIDPIID